MKWEPIESAPRDRVVLVTFHWDCIGDHWTSPGIMVAYWDAYYAPGGSGYDGGGDGWTDASSGEQCHLHYGYPTHWMPLPDLPDEPRYTITEAGRAMLRDAQQSSPDRQQGE